MPTSYNLTGDLGDLLAAPSIAATARAWLETNLDGTDALVDTTGQVVRLGGTLVPVEPDGTFTATGLAGSDSTDLNVGAGTLQYQLVVEYRDPGTSGNYKRTWRSGWFFLNATSDIAALAKSVTPAVAATGAEIVAAAAAEADRAELAAEAAVAPTDTTVAALAQDPESATGAALSATIAAEAGPRELTAPRVYRREEMPARVRATYKERLYGFYPDFGNWAISDDYGTTWVDQGINPQSQHGGPPEAMVVTERFMFVQSNNGSLWRAARDDFFNWTDVTPPGLVAADRGRPGNIAHNGRYLLWGNYNNASLNNGRIFRSPDNGGSWVEVLPYATSQARHVHMLAFDPIEPTIAWASMGDVGQAGKGFWKSTDEGATWTQVSNNLYGINFDFQREGAHNRLIIGNDGPAPQPFVQALNRFNDTVQDELIPLPDASWTGSERGIKVTSQGLFFMTDGEGGAIGTRYGIWLAKGPDYTDPVLLEEYDQPFRDGLSYELGGYVFFRNWRITLPGSRGERQPGGVAGQVLVKRSAAEADQRWEYPPNPFGLIYTMDPALANPASAIAANRAIFMRVTGHGTVSKIGLGVGVSSGNICVGVYRNTGSGRGSRPGVRMTTTGIIACPAAGYQEVTLPESVEVRPGDWFALSVDNNTATFLAANPAQWGGVNGGLMAGRSGFAEASHPLPFSFPTITNGISVPYILVGVA